MKFRSILALLSAVLLLPALQAAGAAPELAAAGADMTTGSTQSGLKMGPAQLSLGSSMSTGNVIFFGSNNAARGPLLVIYADGRIVTSGAALPDEGARMMLEALRHIMRSAYQDLKSMDAALAVLERSDATAAEKAKAAAEVKQIRSAWAPKFAAPPVGPQPEDAPPAAPAKP